MAVESRFRPQTVAEWLQLLPGSNVTPIQNLPTQAVPTIDLSVHLQEKFPGAKTPNTVNKPSPLKNFALPKYGVPKALLGVSIAFVAATAGFSITSLFSHSQQQPSAKPLFEQPPMVPVDKKTNANSNEGQDNAGQNSQASFSTQETTPTTRRRRRNLTKQTTQTPTNNYSPEQPPQQNTRESERPATSPTTSPTPSLVEQLREIRSSRRANPANAKDTTPPANQNLTTPQIPPQPNSVVVPTQPVEPKNSDSSIVVPTVEVKPNTSGDSQSQTSSEKNDKPTDNSQSSN
jgi:serine/threonine-protein kinase